MSCSAFDELCPAPHHHILQHRVPDGLQPHGVRGVVPQEVEVHVSEEARELAALVVIVPGVLEVALLAVSDLAFGRVAASLVLDAISHSQLFTSRKQLL